MTPGSQAQFLEQLQAHGRMLGQVARAYTRSDADRADLESEMVAQLWRAYPRYDAARSFSTWMYRIALNVAISFGRRYRVAVPLGEAGGALAVEPRPHEEREERAAQALLWRSRMKLRIGWRWRTGRMSRTRHGV